MTVRLEMVMLYKRSQLMAMLKLNGCKCQNGVRKKQLAERVKDMRMNVGAFTKEESYERTDAMQPDMTELPNLCLMYNVPCVYLCGVQRFTINSHFILLFFIQLTCLLFCCQ